MPGELLDTLEPPDAPEATPAQPQESQGLLDNLQAPKPEEMAAKRTQVIGDFLQSAFQKAGASPLEAWAIKHVLTSGGKVGDVALNTILPIGGSIAGGAAGAAAGLPEGGVGAIPGSIAGARIGGAAASMYGTELVAARQFIRGETNQIAPSIGELAGSAALGGFVPNPVASAGTLAGTIAKTIATRGGQGFVLGATHNAIQNLIDNGKLNLGDMIKSGGWGALFGMGAGGVESALPGALGLLKSINGKTPQEAAKIIAASNADGSIKTQLQQRIDEMVGYNAAQEVHANPPATPEGALAQTALPPAEKSARESAAVMNAHFTENEMADQLSQRAGGMTQRDRDFQYQLDQEVDHPEVGVTFKGPAEQAAQQMGIQPIKSARESASVFANFMTDQEEDLRGMQEQFRALDAQQRTAWEPENLPSMSDQAQKMYQQYGFISPKVMSTLAGGAGGFVYGTMQPGSKEDKLQLGLIYGALGLAAGYGVGTGLQTMVERGGLKSLGALLDPGTLRALWKQGAVNEAMTYTRDAADTKAMLTGNEVRTTIQNVIMRSFPNADHGTAADALSFVVESKGSQSSLNAMAQKIASSTDARPYWRNRAQAAIAFAKENYGELSAIADIHNDLMGAQVSRENANGVDTLKRDGYVMHAQDIDTDAANPLGSANTSGVATGFKKVRSFDTFADSIAAGVDPKSLDASELAGVRVTNGEKLINRNQWVDGMKSYVDPGTGNPLVADITTVTRADGSTYRQAPKGYTIQDAPGGRQIALLDGYGGIFHSLTDPSAWMSSPEGQMAMKLNSFGKSTRLLIDTFHSGRIAFMEGAADLASGHLPVPAFIKNAITKTPLVSDTSEEELGRIAAQNNWSSDRLQQVLQDKGRINSMVEKGLNIGSTSDNLNADIIHSIPVVGAVNKFIFGTQQRAAIQQVALYEYERQASMFPELSPDELSRQVAKDVNVWFRNLGRQGLLRSQTARDTARFLFLAPQWTEGGIRQELGAVAQGYSSFQNVMSGKSPQSGLLLRGTGVLLGGQFVANQIINQYTRGCWTWENPEEGPGAKISAWVPDKIGGGPGFFLNPLGIGAEIAHVIMSRYEKTGDINQSMNEFVRGRESAAMAPLATWMTRTDQLGRGIKPQDLTSEVLKSAIPSPIPSSAVSGIINTAITGRPQQQFTGQFQKQAMSTIGLKTDQVPSSLQRIEQLASDFGKSNYIQKNPEFYSGDFSPLTQALRVGNDAQAQEEMDIMLKQKTSAAIEKHYETSPHFPFTGSKPHEKAFYASLTPEQQGAYTQAVQDKLQVSQKAIKLLQQSLAGKQAALSSP